jgi:uncharacterized protein
VLTVTLSGYEPAERCFVTEVRKAFRGFNDFSHRSPEGPLLSRALECAFAEHLKAQCASTARRHLKEAAHKAACSVFRSNLHSLLLHRPVTARILSLDPGFTQGVKGCALSEAGAVLDVFKTYLNDPKMVEVIAEKVRQHRVQLIAIGNGIGSRETEAVVTSVIRTIQQTTPIDSPLARLRYAVVSEVGASVYSASPVAVKELPDLDVTYRGAVSIGRRLQDPMAELVKIDPQSLGVGMYQHDVPATMLKQHLEREVESCVSHVGVDVNTASKYLLSHVPGLPPAVVADILKAREIGPICSRSQLSKLPHMTADIYETTIGFLRVRRPPTQSGAKGPKYNPLENTHVHPESYRAAERMLELLSLSHDTMQNAKSKARAYASSGAASKGVAALARDCGIDEETCRDILGEMERPGVDPRESLPYEQIFKSEIRELKDLVVGAEVTGRVTNCVAFGAFVDCGVGRDGLIHFRQMVDASGQCRAAEIAVGRLVRCVITAISDADAAFRGRAVSRDGPAPRSATAPPAGAASGDRKSERSKSVVQISLKLLELL